MVLREDEWIKLTSIRDGDLDAIDIRIWRMTPTGGIPTKRSICFEDKLIVPLIIELQKMHRIRSRAKARKEMAV